MASVTPVERAHGCAWRVQARDGDGKMRQESFSGSDARAVEKAARKFAKTVDRLGIAEASRIRSDCIARDWTYPHLGELPIDSIDDEDVRKWVAWMET